MGFHRRLLAESAAARQGLLATPIIQGALAGHVSLPSYVAFLGEAYHHVRHTVPLLQATQAALPSRHAWLRGPLDEYIEEESGHDEWILADIAAANGVNAHHWQFGNMPKIDAVKPDDVDQIVKYVRWLQRQAGIQ